MSASSLGWVQFHSFIHSWLGLAWLELHSLLISFLTQNNAVLMLFCAVLTINTVLGLSTPLYTTSYNENRFKAVWRVLLDAATRYGSMCCGIVHAIWPYTRATVCSKLTRCCGLFVGAPWSLCCAHGPPMTL
jgi:hypothetical protein